MAADYVYDVLPLGSIRLLTLLPGDSSSTELHVHLNPIPFTHSLADSNITPSYKALWGESIFFACIICDDLPMRITENLFEALQYLKTSDTKRIFWVDALCINQLNNAEKNYQIRLMKDIYAHATSVLIWLGPSDASTLHALHLIDHAATLLRSETGKYIPVAGEIKSERQDNELNVQRSFPPFEADEQWLPLNRFFSRPYFGRVWVFQECGMATSAAVLISEHERDWATIGVAAMFFSYKSYTNPVKALPLNRVFGLWSCSRIGFGGPEWMVQPLVTFLAMTQTSKASDPRDKMYSLLGLAEEGGAIEADYKKDVVDVYTEVTRYILCHPDKRREWYGLRMLAHVKHYENEPEDEWPSCVHKWQDPKMDAEIQDIRITFVISNCASSAKLRTGGEDYPGARDSIPFNPYSILISGFIFDAITSNVNFLQPPPSSRPCLWDSVLDILSIRPDRHSPYTTGLKIDEAFALTLTMADTIGFHLISVPRRTMQSTLRISAFPPSKRPPPK
jgi:hypothetical protein